MRKNLLLNNFLNKQQQIYNEFEEKEYTVKNFGMIPNPKILNGQNGYLIALCHPQKILRLIEETSREINKATESIIYDKDNIHTTITTYLQKDFMMEPSPEIFDRLIDVLQNALEGQRFAIEINFKKFLYNQDSVIAAGYPNEDFISLSNKIVNSARFKNIELRFPKMAHITVSRFVKKLEDRKQLENFEALVNEVNKKEIGVSRIEKLMVGHFTTTAQGFNLRKYREFSL